MEKVFTVDVKKDHLDKISRTSALQALTELVWNSFDADAESVHVNMYRNELDSITEIIIKDDGNGIPYNDAEDRFSSLGGSWKRGAIKSNKGRYLHGKEGQGRFKSFTVGRSIEWLTTFKENEKLFTYSVTGKSDNKTCFYPSVINTSDSIQTGTVVSIKDIHSELISITPDKLIKHFLSAFSIYLSRYKEIRLYVNETQIDPNERIEKQSSIDLAPIEYEGKLYNYKLKIIEWNLKTNNEIYLCNENEFPLSYHPKKAQGTGEFTYTAYVISEHIGILNSQGLLDIGDLVPSLREATRIAIDSIKQHFLVRKIENHSEKIKKWKQQEIYPYKGQPNGIIEEAERQVFDILAINISEQINDFDKLDLNFKKFQFRLLQQIASTNPNDLHVILTEVLNLPKEKQQELADLLKHTTISSIISSAKIVTNRLKFLAGLEEIIFNPDNKKVLKERSQLHKILADNTWIFGDAFSLTVNDQSLGEVLRIHLEKKGIKVHLDKPVKRIDNTTGIVDLMLTRSIGRNHPDEREHLIIELKAPKVDIGEEEIRQIKSYAFATIKDERFKSLKTRWNFWIISNNLDAHAEMELKQDTTGRGIIYNAENVTIFIKTWGSLIQECKHRLEFIKQQLNLDIDKSDGLKYLQETYAEYTKDLILENDLADLEA